MAYALFKIPESGIRNVFFAPKHFEGSVIIAVDKRFASESINSKKWRDICKACIDCNKKEKNKF
jgi:hypothetical protein